MERTLIKDVKVYDGSGAKPFRADVLIEGEKIKAVGQRLQVENCKVIDAQTFALSPGFIDTHSHSDLEVFRNRDMQHIIRQGITTELVGQDGSSVAPVSDKIVKELADNVAPLAGVIEKPFWWRSYGDYLNEISKVNPATRVEGLVGHGTVRMYVMGNDNRKPTEEELKKMKNLIAKSMEEGAKGVSLGMIYPPGSYGDTEELIEVCKTVADYDGIVMVHMRNEQDELLASIDEMERVARESKVRLHISHLKALGYRNWGKIERALEKIDHLRQEGLDVTFDQYPYTATCTGLKVIVPMWAYEGGEQGFQNRLKQKNLYNKILEEVNKNIEARGGAEKILIGSVATEENNWMSGKDLQFISNEIGLPPGESVLKLLQVEGPSVVAIYFSISEQDVERIMESPVQGVCTDGIVGTHPHPRAYGAFPRFLGYYCKKLKLMEMEEAIRRITMEPARRLRLWDRGLIREGMSADLVLFDPQTIGENNSYLNPKVYPRGIEMVWVKGDIQFQNRL